MNLEEMRRSIDEIDTKLIDLFARRMDIAGQVASYKKSEGLPVFVPEREAEIIRRAAEQAGDYHDGAALLMRTIVEYGRLRQHSRLLADSPFYKRLQQVREMPFPARERISVACQGVAGAYTHQACRQAFAEEAALCDTIFFPTWEDVFKAVDEERCHFGVLPIENSTAGSVTQVYDLFTRYRLSIFRGVRLKIDHCLLGKEGATLDNITDVYSHPQAIEQCSDFLREHPHIQVHIHSNTAVAAQLAASVPDIGVAAIASPRCAELYGLNIIRRQLQNQRNNYTRFVVISKQIQVLPGSRKISLCLTLPHHPGTLHGLLTLFAFSGVNLMKLESRPLPDRPFEFMFFFDFEGSLDDERVVTLLSALDAELDSFTMLGSYTELEG